MFPLGDVHDAATDENAARRRQAHERDLTWYFLPGSIAMGPFKTPRAIAECFFEFCRRHLRRCPSVRLKRRADLRESPSKQFRAAHLEQPLGVLVQIHKAALF